MTNLIAELGTLHLHDEKGMYRATEEAFKAGADLVKTQLIDVNSAWWANSDQVKRYQMIQWSVGRWKRYFKWARKQYKDQVFASVWDLDLLWALDGLLPLWKLGHKAFECPRLLEAVASTGKTALVSCSGVEDLNRAKAAFQKMKDNLKCLYVVPQYPTPIESWFIPVSNKLYQGVSAHYEKQEERLEALKSLMGLGFEYVEVHVQGEGADGPDTTFALTLEELRELKNFNTTPYTVSMTNSSGTTQQVIET